MTGEGGKQANLLWIRSCGTLFVSNMPQNVTTKELFGLFHEVGFVFDVFVPKNRATGGSRGFGFVRLKTEWDTNKAISLLNGRLVGGKRFSVQKQTLATEIKVRMWRLIKKSKGEAYQVLFFFEAGTFATILLSWVRKKPGLSKRDCCKW